MLSKDHSFRPQCSDGYLPHYVDYPKSSSGLPLKAAASDAHGSSLGEGTYVTELLKQKPFRKLHSLILTAGMPVPLERC